MYLRNLLAGLAAIASISPVSSQRTGSRRPGSGNNNNNNNNNDDEREVYPIFDNKVIFTPSANFTDPRVLYARSLELSDGTLLATWENYSPEPPLVHFPVYESRDHGDTWAEISQIHDTVNGWGLRYQPDLFELPRDVGEFPAGTIICSGNSIPTDLSETQIDVYASRDKGRTWEFVSHVASGGVANPVNEETPVWEPHMIMHEDTIILYYADQRPADHGQVISHQTTKDLRTWTSVVHDAIYDDYTDRPGMPSLALLPDGRYIYAYEYGGDPAFSTYQFPIHYRLSADPTAFRDAPDYLVSANGRSPTTGPYVVWTPWGGANGTIILSAYQGEVWSNQALGDPAAWRYHSVAQPSAYTRSLRIFKDRPELMIIIGAGYLPPSTTNKVSLSIVDLNKVIV